LNSATSFFKSLFSFFGGKIPREERKKLRRLEAKLQYRFKNLQLLKRALTHKSYANEYRMPATDQNERYEFLGDAVLELAISDLLMKSFPESTEGDLSKLRASAVNEQQLADIARRIQLGDFLFLGRGEDQCQGREKDSLLSDAFEAVLGAIYFDSGFVASSHVVQKQFGHLLKAAMVQDISRDYKTRLQEESQNRFQTVPNYQLMSESGPDHDKTFEIHLFINRELFGQGLGKSKKQAEQNAALEALKKLVSP